MGLILNLVGRLVGWAPRWLKRKLASRLGLEAATASVARELRFNATEVQAYHDYGKSPAEIGAALRFDQWDKYSETLHLLERKSPGLWPAIGDAYDECRRTASHGGVPPTGDALNDLADRLEEALS
jgi:hypothetical protein